MSADGYTVCPKCHPDLIGWQSSEHPGSLSTDFAAEELGYDRSVRENWSFYIRGGNTLVSEYDAVCWMCRFHFSIDHEDPIPGLEKRPLVYFCLDCNTARTAANDSAEVTCSVCGSFRMDGFTPLAAGQKE